MNSKKKRVHDISDSEDDEDNDIKNDCLSAATSHSENDFGITKKNSSPGKSGDKYKGSSNQDQSILKHANDEKTKKRKLESELSSPSTTIQLQNIIEETQSSGDLPSCRYGSMCYQTNATHVANFSHVKRDLGFYLTKCQGLQSKYNSDTFTRSLHQILHEDVNDVLESAVHFSYMYEMEWLLNQYPPQYREIPMLLVVQHQQELLELLIAQRQVYRNVFLLPIKLARFGTHHTKMISLKYKNSLRIIVSTANLYEPDWSQKTQMVWVSPMLKKIGKRQGADSATGFRASLCAYLRSYQKEKLLDLAESYADYDFSEIQSYFIGSNPQSINSGLMNLGRVLEKHAPPVSTDCPLTFCFSSIGSLGTDDSAWLRPVYGRRTLSTKSTSQRSLDVREITQSNIKAVYPTVEEVRCSLEGYEGGRSLPYSIKTHMRQNWLSKWLHNWKADRCGRSRANPHVKFYIRTSENYDDTYWFLMTSANLSKAAWGSGETKAPLSYECGILHVPTKTMKTKDVVVPFDLPPTRYKPNDRLWVQDVVHSARDDFNRTWDSRRGGCVESNVVI